MDDYDYYLNERQKERKLEFNNLLIEALTKNSINIITNNEIEKGEKIGEGEMGKVYIGIYKGKYVAIKKLYFETHFREFDPIPLISDIVNEINIIDMVKHDTTPLFIGIWNSAKHFRLVFEYTDGQSIKNLVTSISFNDKIDILIKLVTLIEFIHKYNLIYREILLDNIMISTKEHNIKLTNFGMFNLKKLSRNGYYQSDNLYHIPPEAFQVFLNSDENLEPEDRKLKLTPKYDIWSIGTLISELFSGILPWSNKVKGQLGIQMQLIKKIPFPVPKKQLVEFPEIIKIIEACTKIDVDKRCNATQLLELLRNIKKR